ASRSARRVAQIRYDRRCCGDQLNLPTIDGFTEGAVAGDVVDISAYGIGGTLNDAIVAGLISDDGTDTTINLGGGNSIILLGVLAANLVDDNIIL
ncbi:hypothetical protein, partial [Shinella sp.]|uniref:hypothetical protein n=1 Tax=Shinella sp. TaxID=1870904 RepID=UPI003F710BA3